MIQQNKSSALKEDFRNIIISALNDFENHKTNYQEILDLIDVEIRKTKLANANKLSEYPKVSLKGLELSKEHIKIVSEFGMIPPKKMEFLDRLYIQRFEQYLADLINRIEKEKQAENVYRGIELLEEDAYLKGCKDGLEKAKEMIEENVK